MYLVDIGMQKIGPTQGICAMYTKCKTCGYDCCADFSQWNCKLHTGGEIKRKKVERAL